MNYCDESLRMISDELYYSVQNKLHANYKRRGKKKAIVHYLLSGKCYCGYCGAAMVGECGKSRNGEIHNYYACRDKKKNHTCHKKNEQKEALEKYVVQQTCLYFLNPDRLNKTADEVLEAYSRQYNTGELDAMERDIKKLEKEAVATVDLIVGAAGTSVQQKRYETKLIEIDERKEALESELLRLEIAVGVKLSHYEVVSWLKEICTGDSNAPDFREKSLTPLLTACIFSMIAVHFFIMYAEMDGRYPMRECCQQQMRSTTNLKKTIGQSQKLLVGQVVRMQSAFPHQEENRGRCLGFLRV